MRTNWTVSVCRDRIVGIATCYELDGPRIESQWGEILSICPDRSGAQLTSCKMGIGVLSRGKAAGSWR
jgi:hypothetical protein